MISLECVHETIYILSHAHKRTKRSICGHCTFTNGTWNFKNDVLIIPSGTGVTSTQCKFVRKWGLSPLQERLPRSRELHEWGACRTHDIPFRVERYGASIARNGDSLGRSLESTVWLWRVSIRCGCSTGVFVALPYSRPWGQCHDAPHSGEEEVERPPDKTMLSLYITSNKAFKISSNAINWKKKSNLKSTWYSVDFSLSIGYLLNFVCLFQGTQDDARIVSMFWSLGDEWIWCFMLEVRRNFSIRSLVLVNNWYCLWFFILLTYCIKMKILNLTLVDIMLIILSYLVCIQTMIMWGGQVIDDW